jgi:5'(3')-deoxyribonucleotidase
MEDDKVALVDLDGSVADYDKALKEQLDKIRSPGEPPVSDRYKDGEAPYLKERRKLIQAMPGFWRNIPKHPLGFDVVEELRALKFSLNVLTKGPYTTPSAWTEKFEWVKTNLPDADCTITQNKSLSYGRILLDDWPPYFIPWLKHRPRGLVVCVAQSWNADMDTIKKAAIEVSGKSNVVRYDGSNRDELIVALRWAYDRKSREV